jgi:hypothetical protein
MWIITVSLIGAAALLAGCTETPEQHMGAAVDNDQNVLTGGPITGTTLDDLPPAVKESLKQRVPHAEIATIEKSKRNGRLVYEFNFSDPDKAPTLDVCEDGALMDDTTTANR